MNSKFALNQQNLAIIGVLDDFYLLYEQIKDVYENEIKQFYNKNALQNFFIKNDIDGLCKQKVRKICEPFFVKHTSIFTSEYPAIHATAYSFENFSCFKVSSNDVFEYNISFVSFNDFLAEIQMIFHANILKRKTLQNPKYSSDAVFEEINRTILKNVSFYDKQRLVIRKDDIKINENTLFLADSLFSLSCYKDKHELFPAVYIAQLIERDELIAFPVHYCVACDRFIVGSKTFYLFVKRYGAPLINKAKIFIGQRGYESFNVETKLHSLGYNVAEGKMTEKERQNLLIRLLDKGYISYFEMCATIEQSIQMFENHPQCENAVQKWKDDLKYIGKYVLLNNK